MNEIQTILHPTDGSPYAQHALRLACSLARDHQARLVVLHVVSVAHPFMNELLVAPLINTNDPLATLEQLRERIETVHPEIKALSVEYQVERGDPVEEILRVAAERDVSLIVLGTHGRTGIDRVLLGSVAEKTVRKAPCSVLTVRAPGVQVAERQAGAIRPELVSP